MDIARTIGSKAIVLWLAREGSYIRESKDAKLAYERLLTVIDKMLAYDPNLEIWIEPETKRADRSCLYPHCRSRRRSRLCVQGPKTGKVVIESAHAILAGLDPSDEMAFCLAHNNSQRPSQRSKRAEIRPGQKFWGLESSRRFHQVLVLEDHGYGQHGEFVGLDVKTSARNEVIRSSII